MKIRFKLILGFLMVTVLVWVVGIFSVNTSQEALQKSIGENSIMLAHEVLNKVDRTIFYSIERWQSYSATNPRLRETLLSSNQEFEQLADIQAYIDGKDKEWTSAPKEELTSFMEELINNNLSQRLRERAKFYEKKYGYRVYGEVFATNKYGVNVAQTGKTTDYKQDDEEWWQKAKQDGLYVADVEYDRSASLYSTDICIRVDDEHGNLLGVIKVILNIEEMINILKEFEPEGAHTAHGKHHFKLITKEGRVIYSTKEFEIFEEVSKEWLAAFKRKDGYFINVEPEKGEKLIVYAHSEGYRDFKSLGWILTIEHEVEEIFSPIIKLKSLLLKTTTVATFFALLMSFFIARSISKPLTELADATEELGKGNLDVKVKIKSNDEVGELGRAFNQMAAGLKKSQEKLQKYSKNLETEVKKRTEELNREVKESKKAKLATLNILEDVDKTKQELDRAYRKLQSLGMMKGEFMNIAAHELKTPLQPIIGYADRLLQQGKLNNWQKERINIILDNAKNLLKLVQDVLDINKMETGIMKFSMEEVDLLEIVKETYESFKPTVEAKKLKFILEIPKTAGPIKVKGDAIRLTQVFSNLIDNAVKFTDQGNISIEVSENTKTATIKIKDTGIGIAKNDISKLFTKFFQIDGSAKRKQGGTGLGLAICKEIVKAHKGKISAQSTLSKGSTFQVILPKLTKPAKRKEVQNGQNFGD